VQLIFWGPEPRAAEAPPREEGHTTAMLARRLRLLGLPESAAVVTHRNQQVMVSWRPQKGLRLHEGYAHAPDDVLKALVRFLTPGTRRAARLAARQIFLEFPVEEFAPSAPRDPATRIRPGDERALARLRQLHLELNHRHFEGLLGQIPILLSGRMRRRLGELRLERKTGRALRITLNRRHVRRDTSVAVIDTLLHEMVHQWQAETGRAVDHGAEFRRKARELGISPRATAGELRPARTAARQGPG
jgi:hypothetical protein